MTHLGLTQTLLDSDPHGYERATQSAFLRNAARGKVPKEVLGQWLANDRLYINGYVQGAGRLLSFLALPETVPGEGGETPATRLASWLIDALVNIRREQRFFVAAAASRGIDIDLGVDARGRVPAEAKLEGLRRFEALFGGVAPGGGGGGVLPWLEGAVVFYGTEKCYVDAWSYARRRLDPSGGGAGDADGGALRDDFIPNWTSLEFVEFVDELGAIVDDAVREQVEVHGEGAGAELTERALGKWREVLAAEEAFWPAMEDE